MIQINLWCFSYGSSIYHIRQSLKYCNGNIISCNRRWLGFKSLTFFSNYLYVKRFFSCFTTLRKITVATTGTILHLRLTFKRGYFHQKFFLRFASSDVLIQRCFLMKYVTTMHQLFFKNSYFEYFHKIPGKKKSATELIFSIVMSFQYALCCKWFSRNFPNIFRTTFQEHSWRNTSNFVWLFLKKFLFNTF